MDRNSGTVCAVFQRLKSLSARRAWIEISYGALDGASEITVALRKESVDRNFVPFDVIRPAIGRSPQGERG